ncbi:MAG: hypothetical protein V1773_03035 [bacterium]
MKNSNPKQTKNINQNNTYSSLKSIVVAVNQSMEIEGCKPSTDRETIKKAKAFVFSK